LYSEQGRNGGAVRLDDGAGAVVSLSAPQVTALLIAVATAGVDMPYSDDAVTASETLLRGLGSNTREKVEDLRRTIRGPELPATVNPRIRRTLEEAVRLQVIVNITYDDAELNRTERSVEATGFFNGTDGWFLLGWCELRAAGRLFRLDRIASARRTRRSNRERDVDEVLGWIPLDVAAP